MEKYKCKICGDKRNSRKASIMHVRRSHKEVGTPVEDVHFEIDSKKKKKYDWQKWQKHPDGSRKFKKINGKWVKQSPGKYYLPQDKKKLKTSKPPPLDTTPQPQILGLNGEPQVQPDGIIVSVLVKVSISFSMTVIIEGN